MLEEHIVKINNEIVVRFFEVFDQLLSEGKIENVKSFCEEVGLNRPYLHSMRTRDNVKFPLTLIYYVCAKYSVNPTYIITGEDTKYLPLKLTEKVKDKWNKAVA